MLPPGFFASFTVTVKRRSHLSSSTTKDFYVSRHVLHLLNQVLGFKAECATHITGGSLKALMMPLPSDLLEKARTLRSQGLNYAEISRRLEVPKTTIYYALNPDRRRAHAARWRARIRGVEIGVEARRYRRLTDEDIRSILELNSKGESISSIARKVGRSTSLVYYVLRKFKVPSS
ncbi:MAG: hypothetical protein DRN06_00225 [Thermoprotei archaeon]|nr:MAG: hypothetical protein DRN06_00225 [Thermoprotei archaeon]